MWKEVTTKHHLQRERWWVLQTGSMDTEQSRAEQTEKPEPCYCPEQHFPAPGESSSDADLADCLVTVLRYDPSGNDSLSHTDLDWLWLSSLHMASLRIDSSFIYLLQGVCPLDMFGKWHIQVPSLRSLYKTTITGDRELPSHWLPPCCGRQVKSCLGWMSESFLLTCSSWKLMAFLPIKLAGFLPPPSGNISMAPSKLKSSLFK